MNALRAAFFCVSPRAFWNWGRVVLGGGFALFLLLLLYLTRFAPQYVIVLPALAIGVAGAWVLFRYPLANLSVVLMGFVLIVSHSEGLNVLEVLYGLYALGFLTHWFVTRAFLYQDTILDTPEAKALFLFLVGVTLSVVLTVLFGGRMSGVLSEWTALAMLGFYYPVKEACTRYRNGVIVVLVAIAWIGLFISVRNALDYYYGLNNAKYLFQIAKGRVIMNDNLFMITALFALVFLVFSERWSHRLLLMGGFLLFSGGMILTQGRALWVSFALAAFVMFVLVQRRHKMRLVGYGTLAGVSILGFGMLFFGDLVLLIIGGLIERASTLGESATADISLMSRVVEAQGALEYLRQSPILGMGMGVSYHFFDIISQTTVERTFIHNGYVGLWYRFGVWGVGLMLFFWVRSVWIGMALFRRKTAPLVLRLCGMAAMLCLGAMLITANTSNPFFLKDTTFVFGLLTGLVAGAHARARLLASRPDTSGLA